MKIIKESYSPEVGPFYIIDGVVFADTECARDLVDRGNGFKDSDNSHYDYWKILQKLYREFRDIDYDYYPRGRVVYSCKEDLYYVYLDECIRDMKNVREILIELNIPIRKVEIKTDDHYKCHSCNKDYVEISENFGED